MAAAAAAAVVGDGHMSAGGRWQVRAVQGCALLPPLAERIEAVRVHGRLAPATAPTGAQSLHNTIDVQELLLNIFCTSKTSSHLTLDRSSMSAEAQHATVKHF